MAKELDLHQFPPSLDGFNNFYKLPADWQPRVLIFLGKLIRDGVIKTNPELDNIVEVFEHVTEDRLPGSEEYVEGFSAALDQGRLGSYFASILIQKLSGNGSTSKINYQEITLEQNERYSDLMASFYTLLKDLVDKIDVESEEELAQGWITLQDFVDSYSEEERDEIAEELQKK